MIKIKVFCDESCHLVNTQSDYMAIGGVYCPDEKYVFLKNKIRSIKQKYNYGKKELKWTKVSSKFLEMYKEVVSFFFESQLLAFNCVILSNKISLVNSLISIKDFDDVYYSIYKILLQRIVGSSNNRYEIFLDRKDSNGCEKIKALQTALNLQSNNLTNSVIERIVEIDSQCNDIIQLADLFTGFVTYLLRGIGSQTNANTAHRELAFFIAKKINALNRTFLRNQKFSLVVIDGDKNV